MKGAMTMKTKISLMMLLLLAACGQSTGATVTGPDPELVERGQYLVKITGCNHCHTPYKMGPNGPEPDMTRMLSGHPHHLVMPPPPKGSGPWGWAGALTNTAF